MFGAFFKHIALILSLGFSLMGCGTYYQRMHSTENALGNENYAKAEQHIRDSKFLSRKRNHLLYFLELGKVQHLKGEFAESNNSLNLADDMMDQYRNLFEMAVGVTINPAMQNYMPEPHERIMVHYYKALNYLQLGNTEEAIVEARRIDLTVSKNSDAVNGKSKKYGIDPFGLILMGMIYEADNDFENAFIAYRNAKKIYDTDETGLYANQYPATLESDLVRTSALAGMSYKSDQIAVKNPHGEAIIFWENGRAPIKEQKEFFFSLNKENGNYFFQSNGLVIPANYDFSKDDPDFKPSDLGIIRIASSYYIPRRQSVTNATISNNGQDYRFDMIQDVNTLAFQIERDDYLYELGKNLLRLSLKKLSELAISDRNEYAGLAMQIANAATEKADTRNWQSLPGEIKYVRIPLNEGENTIKINAGNGKTIEYHIRGNGNMVFRNFVTY